MAAQELEADQAVASVAGTTVEDLASQATAPSHALDSESLLSQPSVPQLEAEPEAEADEPDDVFGDAEPSDTPYEVPNSRKLESLHFFDNFSKTSCFTKLFFKGIR